MEKNRDLGVMKMDLKSTFFFMFWIAGQWRMTSLRATAVYD